MNGMGEISPGIRISLIFLFRPQPETSLAARLDQAIIKTKHIKCHILGCYSI